MRKIQAAGDTVHVSFVRTQALVGRVPSVGHSFTPPPPLSAPYSQSSLSRRISLCRYHGDTNAIDANAGSTYSAIK